MMVRNVVVHAFEECAFRVYQSLHASDMEVHRPASTESSSFGMSSGRFALKKWVPSTSGSWYDSVSHKGPMMGTVPNAMSSISRLHLPPKPRRLSPKRLLARS